MRVAENVVLKALFKCRRGEHMLTHMWAARSLEKHLEASPSPNVVCLSCRNTCLHSHSWWKLDCDSPGAASPGWLCKTRSFWVKGSHTEMNIWCWTETKDEMRESVLPLQFTWQLLSVTGSLWKGQRGSIYQKVGSGFALSEPPVSCSQCNWNMSSYSGVQEELGAFV